MNPTPNGVSSFQRRLESSLTPAAQQQPTTSPSGHLATSLINNFLNQYRRPFSLNLLASYTAQDVSVVQPFLEQAVRDGKVKEIEPGIFVVRGLRNAFNSRIEGKSGTTWSFSTAIANQIMDSIEAGHLTSIRTVGKAIGYSRQFAFRYLEALLSIGAIGIGKSGFYVITRKTLPQLGIHTEKGILSRLRAECGISNHHPRPKKEVKP